MTDILARFEASIGLNEEVAYQFSARRESVVTNGGLADPRERMSVKAVDYAIELHGSIAHLFAIGRRGSAAALLRALLESSLNCLYLLHLSDMQYAKALDSGEATLPDSSSKVFDACARLPLIGEHIKIVVGSKGNRERMEYFHKLAHGDTEQLNRRTFGQRELAFTDEEVRRFILMADFLLLAVMDTFSHALRDVDFGNEIRAKRNELINIYDVAVPEDDPRSPAPAWRA